MHFPAALYLPPDAFDVASNQVIGRRIAGRLLSRAFAQDLVHGEMLTVFSPGQGAVEAMNQLLAGVTPDSVTVRVGSQPDPAVLADIGAIHFPDPLIAGWTALRQGLPSTSFSLTGVIHTVCSDGALRGLGEIPLAPLYPWDAVVCTSSAGRAVVASALEQRLESMKARLGVRSSDVKPVDLPALPVIPLCAETTQPYLPALSRQQRRDHARHKLGISSDSYVVAFVGRLSFHSKCHPLSLYRALDALAAEPSSPPIVLIECGHIFNSWIASAYDELRAKFPRLQFKLVGGLQPATDLQKWEALAASDVFTSPADNLQETFGLSLLEAMAAELPLVVSDWNGYRDLVDHGVNGFLVPTRDALCDLGKVDEIDQLYGSGELGYDAMIGLRSLGVVLDDEAYLRAFRDLLVQPSLRHAMAQSALKILLDRFSSGVVASAYRELWGSLRDKRLSAAELPGSPAQLPSLTPAYGKLFGHYSTSGFGAGAPCLGPVAPGQSTGVLTSLMNRQQLERLTSGKLDLLLSLLDSHGPVGFKELRGAGFTEGQCGRILAALYKLGFSPVA